MIIEAIKKYFANKTKGVVQEKAPDGVCPNCWGRQEWDSQFYELMDQRRISPNSDTYDSFVQEFVTKHIDGIVVTEPAYKCTTCGEVHRP